MTRTTLAALALAVTLSGCTGFQERFADIEQCRRDAGPPPHMDIEETIRFVGHTNPEQADWYRTHVGDCFARKTAERQATITKSAN